MTPGMAVQSRRSLEELVDQVMDELKFGGNDGTEEQSATRWIHEARRPQQAGDIDGGQVVSTVLQT